jgi:hypothetical protein
MDSAAEKAAPNTSPFDTLASVVRSPPKMPAADLAKCAALLDRLVQNHMEDEARFIVGSIGRGIAQAYRDHEALCPSTATPVPANAVGLDRKPYESTEADWASPTWKCVSFNMSGRRQRFQYEVRTDPAGAWFEAIARGAPRGDGRLVEIVQRGVVKDQKVVLLPLIRR